MEFFGKVYRLEYSCTFCQRAAEQEPDLAWHTCPGKAIRLRGFILNYRGPVSKKTHFFLIAVLGQKKVMEKGRSDLLFESYPSREERSQKERKRPCIQYVSIIIFPDIVDYPGTK